MPNATLRAHARTMSPVPSDTLRLRRRLADAAERIIAALDALDAPAEDLEDGHDRENDEAELSGIGDQDGLDEQTVGERSLGFTEDLDQCVGWGPDRASSWVADGEADATEDHLADPGHSEQAWKARGAAAQLREILERPQTSSSQTGAAL